MAERTRHQERVRKRSLNREHEGTCRQEKTNGYRSNGQKDETQCVIMVHVFSIR